MMIGINSGTIAPPSADNASRPEGRGDTVRLGSRRACRYSCTINSAAITKAGRKPAANKAAIETCAMIPYTTMLMQGGIRMPMPEAADTMAAARGAL